MTILTGTETLQVLGQDATGAPAATTFLTTTASIAALASNFSNDSPTSLTTSVGTTIVAAKLITGLLNRSGPTAIFTDTTDTAANIVAAVAGVTGDSFYVDIKNTTAFAQTLTGGTGVTFSSSPIIPGNSIAEYLVTITNATTVVFNHVFTVPLTPLQIGTITALVTVGAGTITAAGIAGGITNRGGAQSSTPFTDTTDIAANIIAAQYNVHVGEAWEYVYVNNTNAVATIQGGTGVTVSGVTSVQPNATLTYLVTYTAAATITMVAYEYSGYIPDATDTTKQIAFKPSGNATGITSTIAAAATAAQVLTLPPQAVGVLASTSGSNLFVSDLKRCTAQVDATTTTLANITGLTQAVAIGTYAFTINLYGTAGGTGGWKVAFNYTTAALSAINANALAFTASAVAASNTTTTTTQTSIIASNTAFTNAVITGTMVVSTAGTVDLQFAENSANSTSSIFVGSTMQFTRIA